MCGPRARNGVSGATGVTRPPRDRAGEKQRLPRPPPRGHSACASRGSPDVVTRADAWAAPWTPRSEVLEGLDIRVSTRFAGDSGAAGPCRGGRSFPALPPPVLGASARVPKPRPVVAGWRPQPQAESGFKAGPPGSGGGDPVCREVRAAPGAAPSRTPRSTALDSRGRREAPRPLRAAGGAGKRGQSTPVTRRCGWTRRLESGN